MSDAIMGTFVKIGTMADGTPRLVLDLQCSLSEVAAMGLIPGVPFAVARMTKDVAGKLAIQEQKQEPKEKPGELCIMACTFCEDPMFWEWALVISEKGAKAAILQVCGISSRKELDTDEHAAKAFHQQIRKPFLAWKEERRAA